MTDKIKSFLEHISADETLKAELKASLEGTGKEEIVSKIIQFAKKHGHEITEEDLAPEHMELSAQELEMVTAGSSCCCIAFGDGFGDGLGCSCALYGTGGVKGMLPDSQGGCQCPGVGIGATRRH